MTAVQTPPLSPQDVVRLQDEAGVELVDGQILEKPMSIESSLIEAAVARILGNASSKSGSAFTFVSSMGYQCFADDPASFRKPDVSVVSAQRLAGIDPKSGFLKIPPDLAVEVLSPNDLAYDVTAKIEEYLANGFPLVWVVYPNTQSVSIYRADGTVRMLHKDDEITAEPILPGFRCKVVEFFPPRLEVSPPRPTA